jgi:ABC-type transport system involved in cytochrome c biogenesis permease component
MSERRWFALSSLVGAVACIGRKLTTGGADGWLDELLLTVALTLIVVGLWPISSRWIGTGLPSLIAPGVTLLFLSLPSRAPIIVRPQGPEKPARRAS